MKFNLNPKETLSNDEIKEGLSLLKLDGIFSQSMSILLSGTFTVPLLLLLGANRFHIGLLSFIISLSSFTQLLSPIIANKFYSRKKVSVLFSLLTRLFLLALSISLILGFVTNIFVLLMFFGFFYLLANISSGTFSFWMLDLVPNDIRGSYFASRTKTSMLIGSLIGLSVALYIGYFITDEKIIYYSFIILLAAILGLIGVFFLANVPEPKFKNLETFSINGMKNLLKVKNIRIHHTAMFLLYLAMGISTPFFIYYLIAILGFDTITVFIVTMTSQFVTIFLLPKWGFLVDKYGVKPVLRLSSFTCKIDFLLPFDPVRQQTQPLRRAVALSAGTKSVVSVSKKMHFHILTRGGESLGIAQRFPDGHNLVVIGMRQKRGRRLFGNMIHERVLLFLVICHWAMKQTFFQPLLILVAEQGYGVNQP